MFLAFHNKNTSSLFIFLSLFPSIRIRRCSRLCPRIRHNIGFRYGDSRSIVRMGSYLLCRPEVLVRFSLCSFALHLLDTVICLGFHIVYPFINYFVTPCCTQVTHLGVTLKVLLLLGFKVCVTLVTPFFDINNFFISCVRNPCTHNLLNINYMSKWVLQVLQVLHFFFLKRILVSCNFFKFRINL